MEHLKTMALKKKTSNRRYLLNKDEPKTYTFKTCKSMPEMVMDIMKQGKLANSLSFEDAGMFADPIFYFDRASHVLKELVEGVEPDEKDLVILNRLSLIFAEVAQTLPAADSEGHFMLKKRKEEAGKLLVNRLGLTEKGGRKDQVKAAMMEGGKQKDIAKRFGMGDTVLTDIKKEVSARYDGYLETCIDSTGETILEIVKDYGNSESKIKTLGTVVKILFSQYRHMLFKIDEIENHVKLACDKLIEDGSIQTSTRNDVLRLVRIK